MNPASPQRVGASIKLSRTMNSDSKIRSIGLIGLGSIAVWLTLALGNAIYFGLASLHWPTVPVRITTSAVNTGRSNLGNWWAPDIEYEYQLDGHSYRGTKIRYSMPLFYHPEEAQAVQAAYSQDADMKASYDPQHPSLSVLQPGVSADMWERALVPVFLWGLMGYIFFKANRAKPEVLLEADSERKAA
ncbi:MAG: DUF3592 domain-containing protein [Candidatus Korobacteraceae bacterium]